MVNPMFYRMNDGVAYFYETIDEKTFGGKPIRLIGDSWGKAYFEYISIGAEDYRFALQDDIALEVRIRILQNRKINTENVVKIKDTYYTVWKVKQGFNKFSVPVTDVTLLTTVEKFEEVNL